MSPDVELVGEVDTVGELRHALEAFTDEMALARSIVVTYHLDVRHGSWLRLLEASR